MARTDRYTAEVVSDPDPPVPVARLTAEEEELSAGVLEHQDFSAELASRTVVSPEMVREPQLSNCAGLTVSSESSLHSKPK